MGRGEEHLLEAAKAQDLPLVQKLIHKGKGKLLGSSKKVNVNYQDVEGFSALHQAAVSGNVDLAYLLIDGGATIDLQDKKGLRPLHYCSWKGKMELVAALLESTSDCNIPSHNGCTPLHLAAQYGHFTVCKILLQYGADISARHSDGNTALDLACEFGRTEVVELLIHSSDSPALLGPFLAQNQDNDYSPVNCPLHLAARNGHLPVVRSLLQVGLDINWRTTSGTCLHEAVSNEKAEIVQLLIDCGIDITKRSGLGQTALELAKKVQKSPTIMEIIRKLSDAQPRLMQVYAINDFQNILDQNSLAFTKGTVITVLEQNPNGNWKGRIERGSGRPPAVGLFPASFVQPYQQMIPNNNMAGSDDSGIHPHDDDTPHWTPPSHWARTPSGTPTKPPQLPHKYVNVDPKISANHPAISKATLVSPNVNNPSYEDVICSHSNGAVRDRPITTHHSNHDQPITVSRSSQNSHVTKPHIANPGYEDVLLDQSNSSSPTNTCASADSGRSQANMLNAEVASQRSSGSADSMAARQHITTEADEQVHRWLASFGMQQYTSNFVTNGYDLHTIARTSPSDLTAIRISKPPHRKKLAAQVGLLKKESLPSPHIDALPPSVGAWLEKIGLREYIPLFRNSNVTTVQQLVQTTWEDLQEMGVDKLGHQKKLMLGISALSQTCKRIQDTTPMSNNFHSRPQNPPMPGQRPNQNVPYNNPRPNNPPSRFQNPPMPTPPAKTQQSYNPRQPPVISRFAPPGPVDPQRKPIVQEKPSKPFSSFRDNPGLSSELQKALTKRQKVIDDDENQKSNPPPVSAGESFNQMATKSQTESPSKAPPPHTKPKNPPTSYPPSSSQARKSSPPKDQVFRRSNSYRGPPPNPPKRTSSICLDDASPLASPVDEKDTSINVKPITTMITAKQPPRSNAENPYASMSPKPSNNQMFRFPPQQISGQATTQTALHQQSTASPLPSSTPLSAHTATSFAAAHKSPNHVTRPLPTPQGVAARPNIVTPSNKPPVPIPAAKPTLTTKPNPAVVPKPPPKPAVSRKPQVPKQPNSREFPPPALAKPRKPNHGEVGKHFDLSVLDRIEQRNVERKSPSEENVPNHKPLPPAVPAKPSLSNVDPGPAIPSAHPVAMDTVDSAPSMHRVDSTDDFDWPAPPPTMLERASDASSQTPVFTAAPLRRPDVTPPSPRVTRTCFEDDEDTGTVKRRPPSITHREEVEAPPQPEGNSSRPAWSRNSDTLPFTQPTTSRDSRAPPPPNTAKPTRPNSHQDSHYATPPSLPTKSKASSSSGPPPISSKTLPKEVNPDLSIDALEAEDSPVESAKAQQMLDDIGSMFDDLVQEFDDILN